MSTHIHHGSLACFYWCQSSLLCQLSLERVFREVIVTWPGHSWDMCNANFILNGGLPFLRLFCFNCANMDTVIDHWWAAIARIPRFVGWASSTRYAVCVLVMSWKFLYSHRLRHVCCGIRCFVWCQRECRWIVVALSALWMACPCLNTRKVHMFVTNNVISGLSANSVHAMSA